MGVYGWAAIATFGIALGLRLVLSQEKEAEIDDRSATVSLPGTGPSETIDPSHYLSMNPVGRVVGLSAWAARASLGELVTWLEGKPPCSALEWRILLIRWAELDVESFRRDALALIEEDEPFTEAVVEGVLLELARQRVRERPRERIAELGDDDPLLHTAYEAWLRKDRAAALEAIEALPDDSQRLDLLQTAAQVWASEDPEQALEWALGKGEKMELVEAVFTELVSTDLDKGWAMLKDHGERVVMETKDQNDFVSVSVMTLVNREAIRNPEETLDWIAGLTDERVQARIVEQALIKAQPNPEDWIERLPFGEARERLAMNMVMMQHGSLRERLTVLAELEGVDHDRLLGKMVRESGDDFPGIAATVDIWKDFPVETRSSIVKSTISMAFHQDPSKAVTWLQELPAGVAEPGHFSRLWEVWAGIDPESASTALQDIEQGPLRDGAVRGLAERIAIGERVMFPDYEAAWHWAQTMSVAEERARLISEIEEAWKSEAPESYTPFFEDAR